jgi:transposase-like protein
MFDFAIDCKLRGCDDEKRALVAETFADGQTVNGVARRHNISRSMLFGWRKQYCETLGFAPPPSTPIGLTPAAIAGPEPGPAKILMQVTSCKTAFAG